MTSGQEAPKAPTIFKTPWWLIAVIAAVALIWSFATIRSDAGRQRRLLEKFYLQKGEVMIRTLGTAAFQFLAGRDTAETMTADLREIAEAGEAAYIVLTDLNGDVKAGSSDAGLGDDAFRDPVPPEDFDRTGPMWRITEDAGKTVFWVYRPLPYSMKPAARPGLPPRRPPLRPQARPSPTPATGAAGERDAPAATDSSSGEAGNQAAEPGGQAAGSAVHAEVAGGSAEGAGAGEAGEAGSGPTESPQSGAGAAVASSGPAGAPTPNERNVELRDQPLQRKAVPSSSSPRSTYYFWVGFDMAEFDEAEGSAGRQSVFVTVVTSVAWLALVLMLLWAHNWKLSRDRERDVEARAEEIVARISSGLFLTDRDGKVILANRAAEMISGLERKDILGRGLADLSSGAVPYDCALKGQEREVAFRGGNKALVSVSAGPFQDHAGEEAGRLVLMTDVGHIVQLREQLAEKERMAGLGNMARLVAHEIRNPLSSILGLAQHLRAKAAEDGLDPFFTEAPDRIARSVRRLDQTVTEVLDYARPAQIEARRVDMGWLLGQLRDFVALDPDWGGAALELTLPARPVAAMADEGKLSEGFLNLFLNAVQAVNSNPPERPGRVEATLAASPDGGAVVTLMDNGPGFSEAQLAMPFQPHFTSKAKGSGLGLPYVKKLVDAHKGTVTLSNREGGGAQVTITLPPAPPEATGGNGSEAPGGSDGPACAVTGDGAAGELDGEAPAGA
ncbi:MAG: PAS domain S-box protein [Deltaproteobacteria bacterium]|jgi:PAS domain S-box-containing protein|nr:PAS domain S-box protein [Deltaproteobacteria bacterium]